MTTLRLDKCSKSYVAEQYVIQQLNLSVDSGESLVLVGESGSGKTTILRMIAGFEIPNSGSIQLGERTLVDDGIYIPPEKRQIGMLFQEYALFPHLTVLENVQFGLHKMPSSKRKQVAQEAIAQVQLSGYDARYPHQLSGGEQQRVALARAIASKPSLLLLDEPFSNLDLLVKAQVRDEIFAIIRDAGITTVSVMHDIQDAMLVADRIALLRKGKLLQVDTPRQLYTQPTDSYTAKFFGRTSLLQAVATEAGFQTAFGPLSMSHTYTKGQKVELSIRPEHIEILSESNKASRPQGDEPWEGRVQYKGFLGSYEEICLYPMASSLSQTDNTNRQERLFVQLPTVSSQVSKDAVKPGDTLYIQPKLEDIRHFPKEEGA